MVCKKNVCRKASQKLACSNIGKSPDNQTSSPPNVYPLHFLRMSRIVLLEIFKSLKLNIAYLIEINFGIDFDGIFLN